MIDQGFCFNAGEWNFPDAPLRGLYARNRVYEGVTGMHSFAPWLTRLERNITEKVLDELLQEVSALLWASLKIPEYILDHDHRRIDDDPEVNRPDRQEIGILAAQHQDDDAEEQSERNVGAYDDGAAQIAEKDPLHQEDQQTAEDKIVQNRMSGD